MNEPHNSTQPLPDRARTHLKQERALRTRARIIQAAAQAFADTGFPNVTIQDVAELAGMTKGAVYFHYANKEALALSVADEFYHRINTIAGGIEDQHLPPLTSVAELLLQTAHALQHDVVIQAGARLQIERAMIQSELPIPYQNYTDQLTTWLNQATTHGHLTNTTPATLAQVLVSAFFGAQHISWTLNQRTDLTERTLNIIRTLIPQALTCTGHNHVHTPHANSHSH
jgi:AcrR family transcriptional regulator